MLLLRWAKEFIEHIYPNFSSYRWSPQSCVDQRTLSTSLLCSSFDGHWYIDPFKNPLSKACYGLFRSESWTTAVLSIVFGFDCELYSLDPGSSRPWKGIVWWNTIFPWVTIWRTVTKRPQMIPCLFHRPDLSALSSKSPHEPDESQASKENGALVCRPRLICVASAEWKCDSKRQVAPIISALTGGVTWTRSLVGWLEAFASLGPFWACSRPLFLSWVFGRPRIPRWPHRLSRHDSYHNTPPLQATPLPNSNQARLCPRSPVSRHRSVTCCHPLESQKSTGSPRPISTRSWPHVPKDDLSRTWTVAQNSSSHRCLSSHGPQVDHGPCSSSSLRLVLILPRSVRQTPSQWQDDAQHWVKFIFIFMCLFMSHLTLRAPCQHV